jgi:hypothetical protein
LDRDGAWKAAVLQIRETLWYNARDGGASIGRMIEQVNDGAFLVADV